MTSHDARPSSRTGYTSFEEELVNAMNEFANSADAPSVDTVGIVRKTRRKRVTAIAGLAAALIVAGGGTALATVVTNGSHAAKPAAATTATGNDATNVLLKDSKFPLEFAGLDLDFAKQLLLKGRLKLGTVSKVDCGKNGKPGSVHSVDPHSPKTVSIGATINLTLCAG
ncbi:hypothetical protein ACFV2U_14715 [Streptomyces sp. NPDC059697]|uniref:hypothetical protein n=1 Tax=Streptomyces sp. NPDC059697 TaxID=3346912 RepID=UPI0036C29EFF